MAFVPTVNTALLSDRRPSQIPPTFSTSTSTGASLSTTGESIPVGVPSSGEASAPSSSSTTQPGPSSPPAASTSSAAPNIASPAKALDSLADSAAGSAPRRGSVLEVFSNTPQGGARRQSMLDTFAAQGEKYLNKATTAAQNLINDAQVRGSTSPQTSRSGSVSHPTSAPTLSGSGGNVFKANAPTTLRSSISELSNNISAAVDSSSSSSPATNNVGTGAAGGNTFNANAPTNLRASIGELSGNFDKAVKEEKEEGKGEGKGLLGLVQSTIENLTNTIDSRTKTADHPGLLTQLKQGSEAVLEKAEGLFNTEAAGRRASLATPAATSSTAAAAPTTAAAGPGPSTQASTSGTSGATTIPSTEPIVIGPSSEIIAEASSHSSGIVPTHPGSSVTGNGKEKEESTPVIETTTNTVAHSDV